VIVKYPKEPGYYQKISPLASMSIYCLQIMTAGFWGKGNKIYYLLGKEKDRENQPLKALLFPY
jgi:hypothetical protein